MFSRDVLNALMPDGPIWEPIAGNDFDNLLEGIAANTENVRARIAQLRDLRNPNKTTILSDLEKEYGIIPVSGATTAQRRQRLAATMFNRGELPTYDLLEQKLQAAGFDVYVHENSPAVDPAGFIERSFQMTAGETLPGGNDSQCGEPEAYCGSIGGYLLVNGQINDQSPNYSILCDEPLAQCGESLAYAGQYDGITLTPIEYDIPAAAGYWPLIFFVGGEATRNALGEITGIDIAPIPAEREFEFKRIILKYKPMFSWAGLIVVWS